MQHVCNGCAPPKHHVRNEQNGTLSFTPFQWQCRVQFTPYVGYDYHNNMKTPPAVKVEDIDGSGLVVADIVECAAKCAGMGGCNAASYYGDLEEADWPAGKNCWPKTILGCGVPADAEVLEDMTTLLIKADQGCAPPSSVKSCACMTLSGVQMPARLCNHWSSLAWYPHPVS